MCFDLCAFLCCFALEGYHISQNWSEKCGVLIFFPLHLQITCPVCLPVCYLLFLSQLNTPQTSHPPTRMGLEISTNCTTSGIVESITHGISSCKFLCRIFPFPITQCFAVFCAEHGLCFVEGNNVVKSFKNGFKIRFGASYEFIKSATFCPKSTSFNHLHSSFR